VAAVSLKRRLRCAVCAASVCALTACGEGPNLSEIQDLRDPVTGDSVVPQIAARQSTVKQMKSEGICTETSSGSLARSANASRSASVEERRVIEKENYHRELIFNAIAKVYKLEPSEIKSLFYEMQRGQ